MVYAITYHDNEVGNKAQAELSAFMGKKRTQFDLKLAKFFYDLYQKDVDGINCGLQELCDLMGKKLKKKFLITYKETKSY